MNVNENKELKGSAIADVYKGSESLNTGETKFKDEIDKLLNNPIDLSFLVQSVPLNPTIEFDSEVEPVDFEQFSFDTKTIEDNDAMFFLNISADSKNINLQMNDETSVIDASNYKTMEVSKTLSNLLVKSAENNKALRLDFDNKVTVVLKISKEGKIDASFFPRDKEVENYLKNNIDYLKVRFDEQSIAYSNISYKPYRNPNRQNNRSGEKSHE